MDTWRTEFLNELRADFALQRKFADRAIAQLDAAQLFQSTGDDDNSVAVIMKHVGGNLRSRWTDPFTTDGEKPDRDRDSEFVTDADDATRIHAIWERGWSALEQTLRALQPDDLERTLMIRGEPHSLSKALLRSFGHTCQHVGQIIMRAKQLKGTAWETLSIPRGQSAQYLTQPPKGV